jgi:replication factor C subunit 2/4
MNENDIFNKNHKTKQIIPINLPWVEKYRPKTSDEILLDPFIKEKIDKIIETKSIPNMIITGIFGSGKTSTILILAKKIYDNPDVYNENVLELNASDDRGLSIINNTILPFCKKKTKNETYKLVILDEADSITTKAQNLLSNIIAEYRKNTRFVFICNDCSQIIESIQSRCMIIKYNRISKEFLYSKVVSICVNENITYTEEGIESLLFISDYDIRQIINNLECIYYALDVLSPENIYLMIDKPKPIYIEEVLKYCLKGELYNAINIITELYNKGYTPNDILLTFMKCIIEKNFIDENIDNDTILKIYEILSLCYIRVNGGIDTLLQLCGCISKIYIYLDAQIIKK